MKSYKYTDTIGKVQIVYAWKLVLTDKTQARKRDDISLREKEKEIQKDLDDGIDTIGKKMTVCELYAKQTRHPNVKRKTKYFILQNRIRNSSGNPLNCYVSSH